MAVTREGTLTLLALMVLESLEPSEGSSSSDHLMSQARLVLLEVVVLVYLLVVVFGVVCTMKINIRFS
jgi:hypothetical protein